LPAHSISKILFQLAIFLTGNLTTLIIKYLTSFYLKSAPLHLQHKAMQVSPTGQQEQQSFLCVK